MVSSGGSTAAAGGLGTLGCASPHAFAAGLGTVSPASPAVFQRQGGSDAGLQMLREGATDAEIADALRQGLPHFTVPASLHDRCAGKQPEGTGTTEKGTQPAAQKKRTHTRRQATQTQPAKLAPDAFAAALGAIPHEDWCRTWAVGRTIMLRRTSKRVKEVVDKMRLPAVVRLSRRFWSDVRNGTAAEKLQFVLRQLTRLTTWPHQHT